MPRRSIAVVAAACCLFLGACRGKEADKPKSTSAVSSAPIRVRIHPNLPEYSLTVIGEKPAENNETLRVQKIEIRRGDAAVPFQVIQGLDTTTPLQSGAPQISVVDMNFDGYNDIRLVELQPAGPNIPYLNWLFDPPSGRFVENRALNAITSPQFDPAKREIRSEWRDGATRYGTEIYIYRDGEPVLVRKESKEYKRPGVYTLRVSRLVSGEWRTTEQREVKEP